ncbi:MAG: DUF2497 domain-containing protein [Pseudomonadota bacterium]
MAEQAAKEPTMEEILASIRKIISEDGEPVGEASGVAEVSDIESQPEADALPDPDIEDEIFDDADTFEPAADLPPVDFAEPEDVQPEAESFELDEIDLEDLDGLDEATFDAPPFEPEAAAVPTPVAEPTPPPVANAATESQMPATERYQETVLTDDRTAESAAGALGKLIAGMDLGGDNTIEGLVRELLRPMIKEWLDNHLPRIVEEKVEAEVQRIAKMVR